MLLLAALATAGLPAESGFETAKVSPGLRARLELTEAQIVSIAEKNRQWSAEAAAMSASYFRSPDVGHAGQRDGVRRLIVAKRRQTQEAIQTLLTPAQRAAVEKLRLKMLSDPFSCEAANLNLLALPAVFDDRAGALLRPYVGACVGPAL